MIDEITDRLAGITQRRNTDPMFCCQPNVVSRLIDDVRYLLDDIAHRKADSATVSLWVADFLAENKALRAEIIVLKLEVERLDGALKDAVSALLAAQ